MGKGGAGSDSRSRHEAPWGARMAYAGGALSAVTASGPGMKVMNKKEMDAKRAKPSSAAVLQERAALPCARRLTASASRHAFAAL